jgi:hypothetical protein
MGKFKSFDHSVVKALFYKRIVCSVDCYINKTQSKKKQGGIQMTVTVMLSNICICIIAQYLYEQIKK